MLEKETTFPTRISTVLHRTVFTGDVRSLFRSLVTWSHKLNHLIPWRTVKETLTSTLIGGRGLARRRSAAAQEWSSRVPPRLRFPLLCLRTHVRRRALLMHPRALAVDAELTVKMSCSCVTSLGVHTMRTCTDVLIFLHLTHHPCSLSWHRVLRRVVTARHVVVQLDEWAPARLMYLVQQKKTTAGTGKSFAGNRAHPRYLHGLPHSCAGFCSSLLTDTYFASARSDGVTDNYVDVKSGFCLRGLRCAHTVCVRVGLLNGNRALFTDNYVYSRYLGQDDACQSLPRQ